MTEKAAGGSSVARRGFHVYLSQEAYEGWAGLSYRYGVSMTALAEILGRRFVSNDSFTPDEVEMALQVDRDRRARRR